jgi:hypothetical protein
MADATRRCSCEAKDESNPPADASERAPLSSLSIDGPGREFTSGARTNNWGAARRFAMPKQSFDVTLNEVQRQAKAEREMKKRLAAEKLSYAALFEEQEREQVSDPFIGWFTVVTADGCCCGLASKCALIAGQGDACRQRDPAPGDGQGQATRQARQHVATESRFSMGSGIHPTPRERLSRWAVQCGEGGCHTVHYYASTNC